ncbi:hypothetical protein GCM10027081_02730 [Cupriavidus yeoncheonensis]
MLGLGQGEGIMAFPVPVWKGLAPAPARYRQCDIRHRPRALPGADGPRPQGEGQAGIPLSYLGIQPETLSAFGYWIKEKT